MIRFPFFVVAAAMAGLAGCADLDPETRPGEWRPVGANEANLRAMVAVPGDLALGAAAPSSDGLLAAKAVERLRAGKTYPLPESGISKVGNNGGGAAAPVPAGSGGLD